MMACFDPFTRPSFLALSYLVGLGLLYPIEASASTATPHGPRVIVAGGVTSNASVNLQKNGSSNILESSDESSPSFGVAFAYSAGLFDLGLSVAHSGSGSFRGFNANRPIGGTVAFTAVVNWHYVSEAWGTMYLGFRPGVVLIQHDEHLQSQVAVTLGRQPTQLDGIERFSTGFTFGTTFGLSFRVTQRVSILTEALITMNDVSLQDEADELDYLSTQPTLRVGFAAEL